MLFRLIANCNTKTDKNIPPLDTAEEGSRSPEYSAEDVPTDLSVPEDYSQAKEEGNTHSQRYHRIIRREKLSEKCPTL
jgi:hypothetical protein